MWNTLARKEQAAIGDYIALVAYEPSKNNYNWYVRQKNTILYESEGQCKTIELARLMAETFANALTSIADVNTKET